MNESLYPAMTPQQERILASVKTSTRLTVQAIAEVLKLAERDARHEIAGLVLREALVADAVDHNLFSLGRRADFWMSPEAKKGSCQKTCPSCKVNPCSKYDGHPGMCYCMDCRHLD